MKKNVIYEEHQKTWNEETGEILEVESKIVKKVSAESFMQVFLNDRSILYDIENKSQLRVLVELWQLSQFDTNQVVLVKAIKQIIADKVGCTLQTVDNHISKLLKKGLLIRKETSLYFLNPKYFFKGYAENRPKVIKAMVEYHIEEEN